mmetsp:Transcript_16224/g.13801  ORF Transcript_16224/g.13801 Transcript_16224/m.13801 type:complete len:262 (+) Transcript_16224:175-960(+)
MIENQGFPSFFEFTNSLLDSDLQNNSQQNNQPNSLTASTQDQSNFFSYSMTSLDEDVKPSYQSVDDQDYEATTVLLFKKVPYDASELDIIKVCHPFGIVSDIYMMRPKNYCLVQFKELKSAKACFEAYKKVEAKVRNQNIFVFYTGKKFIYKPEGSLNPPSRFLVLSFTTQTEVITTALIQKILGNFGKVIKLHTAVSDPPMSYVEMEDIGAAISAKLSLSDTLFSDSIKIQAAFISTRQFEQYTMSSLEFKSLPYISTQS